jgi:hypothetical protein
MLITAFEALHAIYATRLGETLSSNGVSISRQTIACAAIRRLGSASAWS